jgi:hypothetical protein
MDRAGPQFGGAIGLGLSLAQALSVPFYVLGFANALVRAFPALDPHYDYYTGAPDRTDMGGYIAIPPGVGPNVRTVMQIRCSGQHRRCTPDAIPDLTRVPFGPTGACSSRSRSSWTSAYDGPTARLPLDLAQLGISRVTDNSMSFLDTNTTWQFHEAEGHP